MPKTNNFSSQRYGSSESEATLTLLRKQGRPEKKDLYRARRDQRQEGDIEQEPRYDSRFSESGSNGRFSGTKNCNEHVKESSENVDELEIKITSDSRREPKREDDVDEVSNNIPTCTVQNTTKMFSLVLEASHETDESQISSLDKASLPSQRLLDDSEDFR